jgi:threonine/homoserine/homoserine lactone efflux protein
VPDAHHLLTFALASLALLVVPGPAVLYIVTRSLDQGRAAGLASGAGVHLGTLVHLAAAVVGVSAVVARSATAYTALRWAGAAYLVVLGVRRLLGTHGETTAVGTGVDDEGAATATEPLAVPEPRLRLHRIALRGTVVNILNPKTALFFLAFLPPFADPANGAGAPQLAVLGLLFIALGACSDSAYALAAARVGSALRSRRRVDRLTRWWSGGTYVGLGVLTAATGRHPTT